jgi:hypothetical protein
VGRKTRLTLPGNARSQLPNRITDSGDFAASFEIRKEVIPAPSRFGLKTTVQTETESQANTGLKKLKEIQTMKKSFVMTLIALFAVAIFAVGCKKEENVNTDTATSDTSSTTTTVSATDTAATGTTGTMSTTDTSMTSTTSTTGTGMTSTDTAMTGTTGTAMSTTAASTDTTGTTTKTETKKETKKSKK